MITRKIKGTVISTSIRLIFVFVFRPDKEWSLNAKIIRRLTDTANLRRSDRDTCFVLDFSEKRGNSCKKIHVKEIIWNFEIIRLW